MCTYVEDLTRFPRLPEHQPDWLREKLSRGGALLEGRPDSAAWNGVRFEASLTHGGEPSGSLDFRPSTEADGWATEIAARPWRLVDAKVTTPYERAIVGLPARR